MKRSTFDESRDQRFAVDTVAEDRALRCGAAGCPNRWSVDAGAGQLCGAHAWAEPHDWPSITQRQQCLVADLAIERARPKPTPHRYTRDEKRDLLARLRAVTAGQSDRDPKAWARELREREDAGEVLSLHQRQCWREALGRGVDVVDAVFVEMPALVTVGPAEIPEPDWPEPDGYYGAAESEYAALAGAPT